jgi:hypothetical protein
MASATLGSECSVRFLLKAEDQPLRDLEGADFETLRDALDKTVDRLAAARAEAPEVQRELGFSCEWWPPD